MRSLFWFLKQVKYNERQVQQLSPPTNITKEALLLLSNAELILQIRNSLLSSHWNDLERAIEYSKNGSFALLEFVKKEVMHARYESENREIFSKLTSGLEQGASIPFGSVQHIQLERSGAFEPSSNPEVTRIQFINNYVYNDQALMDDGGLLDLQTVTLSNINNGLTIAKKYGCKTKVVQDLYTVCNIVQKVRSCLTNVMQLYDTFHGTNSNYQTLDFDTSDTNNASMLLYV